MWILQFLILSVQICDEITVSKWLVLLRTNLSLISTGVNLE